MNETDYTQTHNPQMAMEVLVLQSTEGQRNVGFFEPPGSPDNFIGRSVLIKITYQCNLVDLQKLHGNNDAGHSVANGLFIPGFGGSGIVLKMGMHTPSEWKGLQACYFANPTCWGSYATCILVDR
jgi:hypothetical protein